MTAAKIDAIEAGIIASMIIFLCLLGSAWVGS